jgi:hypothetical protein
LPPPKSADCSELEAQVLEGDRAQATAPRDASSQLRTTARAEADAWRQSADAEAEHHQVRAENARSLAAALAAETNRLEAANDQYEQWSARTARIRERATKAKAELQRRGQEPCAETAPGPYSTVIWWRQFQADADAVDRAIEREHQATIHHGEPWPPERKPVAGHEEADSPVPGSRTEREPEGPKPGTPEPETAEPVPADDGRATRLDELQARVDQAARRIDAQRAEIDASSEHTARIEREVQADPAADRPAKTPHDMEMEL